MNSVYPGSFDPPTNGHLDIIFRASKIFDKVTIAILNNLSKNPMFSIEERLEMLKELTKDIQNVEVVSFSGLLVDFCKEYDSKIILKGLRAVTDFEYEFQMALTNKSMSQEVETLFMPTDIKNVWLSSSVVKEIAILGGEFSKMVPELVKFRLEQKLEERL